jgi:hypothetical protein
LQDNLKQKLGDIFQDKANKEAEERRAAEARAVARANFITSFCHTRETVIEPALRDFSSHIREHGWRVEIRHKDPDPSSYGQEPSTTITFHHKSWTAGTPSTLIPYFSFICHSYDEKVRFQRSASSPDGVELGSRDIAPIPLDKITFESVQEMMVEFFRQIVNAK